MNARALKIILGADDAYLPLIALCVYLVLWKKIQKQEFLLHLIIVND